MNVEQSDKQDSKFELKYEHVENTPFTIVEQDGLYFGIIGKHRITEEFTDREECKESLKEFSWDRVTQVIWAIVEKFKEKETNE